jgi:folate-dependent phosphoribosylglycinamide formyltransferase PurN
MLNYWVRRGKIPITAILVSDFDIKHQGKCLNFFELVVALVQQSGWRYTLFMLCFAKFAVPIVNAWNFMRRLQGKTIKIKTFAQIAMERGIPIYRSRDFNSPEAHAFLGNVNANLIVSAYNNQLLRKETYRLPEFGAINVHPALLPDFRGLDPTFQALLHGVKRFGVTVHRVDHKIDTGNILGQRAFFIRRDDSLFSLAVRSWMHGATVLEAVVDQIRRQALKETKQRGPVRYPYESFPTQDQTGRFFERGKRLFRWRDLARTFKN